METNSTEELQRTIEVNWAKEISVLFPSHMYSIISNLEPTGMIDLFISSEISSYKTRYKLEEASTLRLLHCKIYQAA